ncbi:uncharacterized protein LOC131425206 [Malaya genurostris]|uniref:uncharacterized protein LOC131425206 n=1 Tax=Malaya genurostris TaxID=325434 RepID=UPI0026F391CF|nr:uncharacterized protein LOC131425206 [Malaya genurostris]
MEQIVNLVVYFLMISSIDRVCTYPTPNDILSGKEFLSILMETDLPNRKSISTNTQSQSMVVTGYPYRGSRKYHHFYNDRSEVEDSVLPIESLFTSQENLTSSGSKSYGYRNRHRPRSGKLFLSSTSTSTTTTTTAEMNNEIGEMNAVISGTSENSRLIDDDMIESTTTIIPELSTEMNVTFSSSVTTTEVLTTFSNGQQFGEFPKQNHEIEPAQLNEENKSISSKSYRSELAVDEMPPSVDSDRADPERGESSNIQRVIAMSGTEALYVQQIRGRMQRKQDAIAPQQTVIYHDKDNGQEQHQSVSYSYIGETAPTLKTWKDIDEEYLKRPSQSDNSTAKTTKSSTGDSIIQNTGKIWSEPEKNYSEPAKVWSEPAKIYSEPAKIYSEPAKIYSEPARIYSEPAKVYSRPSSYWQTAYDRPSSGDSSTVEPSSLPKRIVFNDLDKIPYDELNAPTIVEDSKSIHNAIGKFTPKQVHEPPKRYNYKPTPDPTEIVDPYVEKQVNRNDSSSSVVRTLGPTAGSSDDSKVGYVVEGRNYRKYRVEEKTPDGFIVGEYGVLSHNDGKLRGVRYTADSDTNPRLIYDALLKFLSL